MILNSDSSIPFPSDRMQVSLYRSIALESLKIRHKTYYHKERADFRSGGQASQANQGRGIGVARLQYAIAYVSNDLAERRAVYIIQMSGMKN
jgi:hypothetical protein